MRNKTIDIMKGLGILLVVISHAISKNDITAPTEFNNGLFNIITSFFMLMFLMVSGYLIYDKVSRQGWLKEHISKWIYPLLSFAVIYWLFGTYLPDLIQLNGFYGVPFTTYIASILTSGFNGVVLWYLWTLILCYLITWVVEQGRLNLKIPLILQVSVLVIVINLIPLVLFGFFTFKWYCIFFLIGYMLHHYSGEKKLAYISLIAFPLCIYLFNWMKPYQDIQYGCFGLGSIIPAVMNGHTSLIGVMFLMAILGTAFIFSIASLIRWNPLVRFFSYLGSISIGIYLIHIIFVGIVHNYWLSALLSTIISVVLYEGLKRIKITNLILFGEKAIENG